MSGLPGSCSSTRRNTAPSVGLAAAHNQDMAIGRPQALTPEQIFMTEAMTADPAISTRQVAERLVSTARRSIGTPTLV